MPPGLLAFGRWQLEGEQGRAWIQALPEHVEALLARWDLAPDGEAMHGYNGMVLPVRRGQERCALKVSWPPETAACREALALEIWEGRGAVRLLETSPAEGALLLERANSRTLLRDLALSAAVPVAGTLLRRLAVPAPAGPRRLSEVAAEIRDGLVDRWERLGRPFPLGLADQVRDLAGGLSLRTGSLLVNHDLHYDNVLAADREPWLAIDPKVYAGDPEYQVAQLLWTRLDEMDGRADLFFHFHALVDAAELDPDVARAWTVVRCIDYWLWGLGAGFTEDPLRCEAMVDVFTPEG
ncbi:aminoglycoside phosphotransferase family protein [Streptomyces sp. NPDC002896]|uniref:aminoglycoside phosphotransferase family protein n=1 Tax=Streptomyces sp. NPDC002896 TaxID=3154438 RepID=UPI0033319CC4